MQRRASTRLIDFGNVGYCGSTVSHSSDSWKEEAYKNLCCEAVVVMANDIKNAIIHLNAFNKHMHSDPNYFKNKDANWRNSHYDHIKSLISARDVCSGKGCQAMIAIVDIDGGLIWNTVVKRYHGEKIVKQYCHMDNPYLKQEY